VNLVGYLRAEDGVGVISRALLQVLQCAGIAVAPRTCRATPSRQRAAPDIGDDSLHTYDVTITCVNADQLPLLVGYLGARMPLGTPTIGVWAWEVETFPEWMARSEQLVDEVWVYSRHVADALAPVLEVPVHVFAPPITVPDAPPEIDRDALDLSDEFLFLFCFDFHSVFERKNPLAVVEAFRRAFAPRDGPQLLIKSVNGADHPRALARLRAAAADRADIIVRDGYENETRQRALIYASDCYVSLHRAEGYGLTLAEAMAEGRPVIATGYSGNLEFMTDDTAVLVPYEFTSIPYGCDPYRPGTRWAEPNLDYAAAAMRTMASDPAGAAALGARAQAHILHHHAPDTRVDFVRERLRNLRGQR
jgi:glycosyltransferase involved in cell wall biosynthesis